MTNIRETASTLGRLAVWPAAPRKRPAELQRTNPQWELPWLRHSIRCNLLLPSGAARTAMLLSGPTDWTVTFASVALKLLMKTLNLGFPTQNDVFVEPRLDGSRGENGNSLSLSLTLLHSKTPRGQGLVLPTLAHLRAIAVVTDETGTNHAEQNHGSERDCATSVAHEHALGRPNRLARSPSQIAG